MLPRHELNINLFLRTAHLGNKEDRALGRGVEVVVVVGAGRGGMSVIKCIHYGGVLVMASLLEELSGS